MKAVILLAHTTYYDKEILNNAYIIGCDKGAYNAALNGITMDVAIGDFDSVDIDMMNLINKYAKRVIKLNPIKDKTDTSEAIDLVSMYDEVYILGGIQGKRIEHFIANMIELINHHNLILIDEYSRIEYHNTTFTPRIDYKFISLFTPTEATITLTNMKYEVSNYILKYNDPLAISNEAKNNPLIEIKSGELIVIYTKDDMR